MSPKTKICIDQSGKIEQTEKDTVLCLANDIWDSVTIKSATKRQIQKIFRRQGQPRNFIIFTFCAGLAILIKRNINVARIIIDREYYGKEPVIKEILLQMLLGKKYKPELIFAEIGRRVRAHTIGYQVYSGKLPTRKTIKAEEILQAIKMTEVGKRLKNT